MMLRASKLRQTMFKLLSWAKIKKQSNKQLAHTSLIILSWLTWTESAATSLRSEALKEGNNEANSGGKTASNKLIYIQHMKKEYSQGVHRHLWYRLSNIYIINKRLHKRGICYTWYNNKINNKTVHLQFITIGNY